MAVELFKIGRFAVHGYGLMIGIGVIVCVLVASYRAKKYHLDPEAIWDIAIYSVISGFLGGKLLFVIVEFKEFLKHPLKMLGSEGFVVYGGLIIGILVAMLYCKIKKLVFIDYFDLAVASIAIGQGFGRIGCFLAGCCYGKETDCWIGVRFPLESMAPTGVKVLPTQLFSAAGNFIIAAILIWYYTKTLKKGYTGAMYLTLYGIGRFVIEFFRNDKRGGFFGLSTSQWISFLFVGVAILLFIKNKNNYRVMYINDDKCDDKIPDDLVKDESDEATEEENVKEDDKEE